MCKVNFVYKSKYENHTNRILGTRIFNFMVKSYAFLPYNFSTFYLLFKTHPIIKVDIYENVNTGAIINILELTS